MNVKKNNIKIIDKRVNNINYYDDILDKFDIDVTSFLQKKIISKIKNFKKKGLFLNKNFSLYLLLDLQ